VVRKTIDTSEKGEKSMGINPVPQEEIDRCVRLLGDIARGTNPDQVLMSIQGTVRQLKNGEKVFEMIQKLVKANNADRAAKLLQLAAVNRGGVGRKLKLVFFIALNIAVFVVFVPMMPRCNGAFEPAMSALNACPAAVQLLGAPIEQSIVGMSCGSSESSGAYGEASWRISVRGPKDSGQFEFAGRNQGNGWRLDSAMLTAGDKTLSVWPCGTATTSAPGETLTAGMNFGGMVMSSLGSPAVQPNMQCSISVSPTSVEARDAGYNCHVKVQCGNAVLYGWEGSGYTRCQVANGVLVRADDTTGAASNDDPMLALNVAVKSCVVSNDGAAPFTVTIALTGI
jgi:hypothetical protein